MRSNGARPRSTRTRRPRPSPLRATTSRWRSASRCQTTTLTTPASSSSVTKMTPLAVSGRWRTVARSAQRSVGRIDGAARRHHAPAHEQRSRQRQRMLSQRQALRGAVGYRVLAQARRPRRDAWLLDHGTGQQSRRHFRCGDLPVHAMPVPAQPLQGARVGEPRAFEAASARNGCRPTPRSIRDVTRAGETLRRHGRGT